MRERVAVDLSRLPLHGMGRASVTWWGTTAFMLIEGTGFALVIAVYLYLMSRASTWPIGRCPWRSSQYRSPASTVRLNPSSTRACREWPNDT